MKHPEKPSLGEIQEARRRIRPAVRHTPLVPLHEQFGADEIFLKLESFQPANSFKVRGVFNAVAALDEETRRQGLSTVSAGNTAQALAWTAKWFGVPARSLMPESAPQTKIDAVRDHGGEPVLVSVAELFRFLKQRGWEEESYAFIHPWTNRDVMTGHGTLGLEILEDLPEVESVFIPVGGGGLFAGVGTAIKALNSSVRLIAVEPQGCPAFHHSLEAGKPVEVECQTICDGVAVPYMTEEMFPLLRELADDVRLIAEGDVRATVRDLGVHSKLVVEGSGALSVAAAVAMPVAERGRSVCLITGGNIDTDKLAQLLSHAAV